MLYVAYYCRVYPNSCCTSHICACTTKHATREARPSAVRASEIGNTLQYRERMACCTFSLCHHCATKNSAYPRIITRHDPPRRTRAALEGRGTRSYVRPCIFEIWARGPGRRTDTHHRSHCRRSPLLRSGMRVGSFLAAGEHGMLHTTRRCLAW